MPEEFKYSFVCLFCLHTCQIGWYVMLGVVVKFLQTKFASYGAIATGLAATKTVFISGLVLAAFSFVLMPLAATAKAPPPAVNSESTVALASLPKQANETYASVLSGGPFEYDKDGTVFGNRDRILPAQKRGFYREYTVKTPYARNRGAKRIICGGSQPAAPEACYYTDDHYATFKRIVK